MVPALLIFDSAVSVLMGKKLRILISNIYHEFETIEEKIKREFTRRQYYGQNLRILISNICHEFETIGEKIKREFIRRQDRPNQLKKRNFSEDLAQLFLNPLTP